MTPRSARTAPNCSSAAPALPLDALYVIVNDRPMSFKRNLTITAPQLLALNSATPVCGEALAACRVAGERTDRLLVRIAVRELP